MIYNPTGKPLTSQEVAALLPGVDGYIAGLDEIDRAALETADRLKVIARYGVGVDNVDLAGCQRKGHHRHQHARRQLGLGGGTGPGLDAGAGAADPGSSAQPSSRENGRAMPGVSLEGKTVGILGLGAIGKQLARRLAGFDCRILAYDPFADRSLCQRAWGRAGSHGEVIAEADFVSLHLPLLPETRGLVNDDFLAKMKKGAFLINTSRGEVVDEAALLRALQSGRLRGAGLDAFIQSSRPTRPTRCCAAAGDLPPRTWARRPTAPPATWAGWRCATAWQSCAAKSRNIVWYESDHNQLEK